MPLPPFNEDGDLPPGVHRRSLGEAIEPLRGRLTASPGRRHASRSDRPARPFDWPDLPVDRLRFLRDGQPDPDDVDLFLLVDDSFDAAQVAGEARLIFDHAVADAHFGASVFWMRRLAAFGGEQAAVEYWQTKRDQSLRGIIEIIPESEQP